MSDGKTKQRFSARVKTETLDQIEEYQETNSLDNRSNAIEVLVAEHTKQQQSSDWWETVAQQSLYAVTFALTASSMALVSFLFALVVAGYPSVWTVISVSVLLGGVLVAIGGGLGYRHSRSRAAVEEVEQ